MAMGKVDSLYLFRLARERSEEGREQFAHAMGDLFLERFPTMSDEERTLAFDILGRTIHDVEMEMRQQISVELAERADVPRELVKVLANDAIEIAQPILSLSPVLLDSDLIEVVHARGLEHQLAIAQRPAVSSDVSSALIEIGNPLLISSLLLNPNAEISSNAFTYLVEESRRVDSLREPLVRRHDLPPALAARMIEWVGLALRQYILDNHAVDAEAVNDALVRASAAMRAEADERQRLASAAQTLAASLEAGADPVEVMAKALREGEIALFISMFDERTKLGYSRIMRLLQDLDGHGLAVACKAAGLGKAAFVDIYTCCRKARHQKPAQIAGDVRQALSFYDMVDADSAVAVVKDWWLGTGYREALREVKFA
jgi:uncharacterized protein (DUF2336 family)